MLAWHFVGATLRDGSPVPADGVTLRQDGALAMCESGLHASRRLLDALRYAPGSTICRVRCGGEMVEGADKLVSTERTILWRVNGEALLREFARDCALEVLHLWARDDTPDIDTVVEYLLTGDEALRAAAARAAWAAARAAAMDAYAAASDAAYAAASAAASDAAYAAASAAASDAAYAAAYAAYAAATDAANDRLTRAVMAAHKREGP